LLRGPYLDQLRGAGQPDHADEHAPLHAADQCLLKEGGQSQGALALYFMHYNFARIHKTLRVTPAMEASVADHVWSFEEIARLVA
jgi:hypothetical protein